MSIRAPGIWLAVSIAGGAVPIAAQQPTPEEVGEVIATSKLRDVVGGAPDRLLQTVTRLDPSLGQEALDRIRAGALRHFSQDALYATTLRRFQDDLDPVLFRELQGWLLEGPVRAISDRMDADEPAESLEEYARRVQTQPPPRSRIELASRFAEAQRAGEFYLVMSRGLEAAARAAIAGIGGEPVADAEPTGKQADQMLRQFHMLAVVSFLQRMEPLTDAEASRLVKAYESASGRWYAEAYTNALRTAFHEAGLVLADRLRASR